MNLITLRSIILKNFFSLVNSLTLNVIQFQEERRSYLSLLTFTIQIYNIILQNKNVTILYRDIIRDNWSITETRILSSSSRKAVKLEACKLAGIGSRIGRPTNCRPTVCNNYRGSRERREKRSVEGRGGRATGKGQRGLWARRTEKERRAERRERERERERELRGTMKSLTGRSEHNAPWSTLSAPTTDPPHNPTRIVRPINIVLYRESWDEPALWLDRSLPSSSLSPATADATPNLSSSHTESFLFCSTEFLSYSPRIFLLDRANHPPLPILTSQFPRLSSSSASQSEHRFVSLWSMLSPRCFFSSFSSPLSFLFFLSFTSFLSNPPTPLIRLLTFSEKTADFIDFVHRIPFFFPFPRLRPVSNPFSLPPSFLFSAFVNFFVNSILNAKKLSGLSLTRSPISEVPRYPGREFHKNRRFRSILAAGRGEGEGGRTAGGRKIS